MSWGECRQSADRHVIGGEPELWRIVLDQMAADESIRSIQVALRRGLEKFTREEELRELAGQMCLSFLTMDEGAWEDFRAELANRNIDIELLGLTLHRPVQIQLIANWLGKALKQNVFHSRQLESFRLMCCTRSSTSSTITGLPSNT